MAWFDTVTEKAKELAGFASQKTSEAVEISRLKIQASQVNTMIHSTYERIGTLVYDQDKSGVDNNDIIAVCIAEIDTLLADMNKINDKISAIKNGQLCPNCGKANLAGTGYCAGCGGKMSRKNSSAQSSEFATPSHVFEEDAPEEQDLEEAASVIAEEAVAMSGAAVIIED